jgi:cysteinyl-tRNA synthetase
VFVMCGWHPLYPLTAIPLTSRAYITFDIMRRIMANHFGYTIDYCMNITDIDDKIITGARHAFLFQQYVAQLAADPAASGKRLVKELGEAIACFQRKRFAAYLPPGQDAADSHVWATFAAAVHASKVDTQGNEKFDLFFKTVTRAMAFLGGELAGSNAASIPCTPAYLQPVRDVMCPWLDGKLGHTVTDQSVFRDFARFWEDEFFRDMDALNILRPTHLTRVSEFVPEVVTYIQRIIDNGYGYEEMGSVYFNTSAFKSGHHYAKLEPWSACNHTLLAEGEGALTASSASTAANFVLWKRSKVGEPSWPSPWGPGRPGWHIECSVMACHVFGSKLDIHSGGIDLAFPHHDNEIAQVEAHYNSQQWVNYFLHAGHLHISGMKMSKSLKNFITIQEALQQTSACTLRIMFLLHPWHALLDYSAGSLAEAQAVEVQLKNFVSMVRALVDEERHERSRSVVHQLEDLTLRAKSPTQASVLENDHFVPTVGLHHYGAREKVLTALLLSKDAAIHNAICDSINTPEAMQHLKELVSAGNTYYNESLQRKLPVHTGVMVRIVDFAARWLDLFGVPEFAGGDVAGVSGAATSQPGSEATATPEAVRESVVMPVARAMSEFRDAVKDLCIGQRPYSELLALCDRLRDVQCVELGIQLSDRGGGGAKGALVKLLDPAQLRRQAEQEQAAKAAKQDAVRKAQEAADARRMEIESRWHIPPIEYFKVAVSENGGNPEGTDTFTSWDADGLPTASGPDNAPVPKSRRKKLDKELANQRKYHDEYLAKLSSKA